MKNVQPPSSDTIWDWAAWLVVAAWVALVEALRRAWRARKDLTEQVRKQGEQIDAHLADCRKYRQSVAEMEIQQRERHRENTARLERIENLLIAKALGVAK